MNASLATIRPALLISLLLTGVACSGSRPSPSRSDTPPSPRRTVMTAADIERYPAVSSVEQLLVQHVPGLQLFTRNDGTMTLIIMGLSNSRTSGEPLYVIDGIPVANNSGRVGINPHDIAWVEVLKDGGAMAEYGLRGAQGVVVIRTKRGGERDPARR